MKKARDYLRKLYVKTSLYKAIHDLHLRMEALESRQKYLPMLQHQLDFENLKATRNPGKRIHFIHIFGTGNVGDRYCGPEFYFSDFFGDYTQYVHELHQIDYAGILRDDVVVIGGGGLLDYSDRWNRTINECISRCNHVVIWGAGINTHNGREVPDQKVDFSKISLIGCRDYGHEFHYVPCVSCMLPQLAYPYPIKRKIGVVEHLAFPIEAFPEYEKRDNTGDIHTILRFIGESEIIITNTYHAWYWATLMSKKVILYDKFSSKFDYLKYPPRMYSGDLDADIEACVAYPEAYAECVKLNQQFAGKIMELMTRPGT